MKRILCFLLILCFVIFLLPVQGESYQEDITPAIPILRNKTKLHKHAPSATGVAFCKEDFQSLLGRSSTHVTLLSLPSYGKLTLKGLEIQIGQNIALDDADQLCFVPGQAEQLETSFEFKCSNRTNANALECVIRLNDSSEISTPKDLFVNTYRDVMLEIPLKDGENVLQEGTVLLCTAPHKGTLTLTDKGSVYYRPQTGYEGRDSFSFQVLDACGALSQPTEVNIKINAPFQNVFFADLKDSPHHCAAIDFIKYTDFEVAKNEQGYYMFEADALLPLTQVEAMIHGIWERGQYYQEVFEEDNDTSPVNQILRELPSNANGEITRLQAAVAVSKALSQTREAEQGLLERIFGLFG